MPKLVYDFTEGNKDLKDLLGGKGANLAEMTNLGLPVPPGFIITTEACRQYLHDGTVPESLDAEVSEHLAAAGEGHGPPARRPRRPAAGQRAVRGQVLDARDDGDGAEHRPVRRVGARPGQAVRQRPVRLGLLPAPDPDVRQDRARHRGRGLRARDRFRPSRPRAPRTTSTWTPTTCAGSWTASRRSSASTPGATSRRTRGSRWTWPSSRCSARGTPTGPSCTGARNASRPTSAPRSTSWPWCSATSAWTPAPAWRSPGTRAAASRACTATTCRTRRARTWSRGSGTPSRCRTWRTSTAAPTRS